MLLARKLLDSFVDGIHASLKDEIYDLAVHDIDTATARLAIMYEEVFKDYPTGVVLDLMIQHLKDRVFQRTRRAA